MNDYRYDASAAVNMIIVQQARHNLGGGYFDQAMEFAFFAVPLFRLS